MPLSKRAEEYMVQLLKFPKPVPNGWPLPGLPEDGDSLPPATLTTNRQVVDKDVQGLKPKMKRQQLIE